MLPWSHAKYIIYNMDKQEKLRLEQEYAAVGLRYYTPNEELWNAITHGIGTPITLAFFIYYLVIASNVKEIVTAVLLCIPALQVFTTSCVYHALTDKKRKSVARRIDHANISFLVIACGVTPAMMFGSSIWNYIGIGACFAIAITGAVLCIINLTKFKNLNVVFNVIIGAICFLIYILNLGSPLATFEVNALYLTGLILCTIGLVLYGIKKIPYVHTIFHVVTLIGPVLFFIATALIFKANV